MEVDDTFADVGKQLNDQKTILELFVGQKSELQLFLVVIAALLGALALSDWVG